MLIYLPSNLYISEILTDNELFYAFSHQILWIYTSTTFETHEKFVYIYNRIIHFLFSMRKYTTSESSSTVRSKQVIFTESFSLPFSRKFTINFQRRREKNGRKKRKSIYYFMQHHFSVFDYFKKWLQLRNVYILTEALLG